MGDSGARERRTLAREAVTVGYGQRGANGWEGVDGSGQSARGLDGIEQMMLGILVSAGRVGSAATGVSGGEAGGLTGIEGAEGRGLGCVPHMQGGLGHAHVYTHTSAEGPAFRKAK